MTFIVALVLLASCSAYAIYDAYSHMTDKEFQEMEIDLHVKHLEDYNK